jgi:hypothetical protein
MKKRFHIGYYLAEDKKMISGKTYIADDLIMALELFLSDGGMDKDIKLVKYIVEMDEVPY